MRSLLVAILLVTGCADEPADPGAGYENWCPVMAQCVAMCDDLASGACMQTCQNELELEYCTLEEWAGASRITCPVGLLDMPGGPYATPREAATACVLGTALDCQLAQDSCDAGYESFLAELRG